MGEAMITRRGGSAFDIKKITNLKSFSRTISDSSSYMRFAVTVSLDKVKAYVWRQGRLLLIFTGEFELVYSNSADSSKEYEMHLEVEGSYNYVYCGGLSGFSDQYCTVFY